MPHDSAVRSGPTDTAHDPIVGIDLGTTNSLVAIYDAAGPRVLAAPDGRSLVPSVVRYEARGRVVVGQDAKGRASDFPTTTIASVKRLMGRSLADAASDASFLPYAVVAGERDTARVRVPTDGGATRDLSPEEVSAQILMEVKRVGEAALGHEIRRAVVTVPAYFDDAQRQATRVAARLAGLDAVRIVPEPTAAALAYGVGLWGATGRAGARVARHVCVYDLGGGTFDVSILRITPAIDAGESDFYEVLAIGGDTRLGGDDFDHALAGLFARELAAQDARDERTILADPALRARLRDEAERAKIELSSLQATRVRAAIGPGRTLDRELHRSEFEALIAPMVDRTLALCAGALRDARAKGLGKDQGASENTHGLDAVILVGGSTRVPLVRARVAAFFGLDPYVALDPERVVAMGASVQGAILSGAMRGSLLLDALPLSLGIETAGGAVAKVIHRNSSVPCRATEMFSTQVDGQRSIRLTVFQGEREMASDCRKLGEFHLTDLPPMPAGVAQVEVEFLVDASGVLSVRATERRSGKRAAMQIVPNHGLTAEEVARIERDSVVHAREDMQRHRIADLTANARLDARWIAQKLAAHRGSIDPAYAQDLDARLATIDALITSAQRDWPSVDANAFHRAKEDLDRASIRLQEIAIAHTLREAGVHAGPRAGDGAGPTAPRH